MSEAEARSEGRLLRWAVIVVALLGCASAAARDLVPSAPVWQGRFTALMENDAITTVPGGTDSWYTHGQMLHYLSAPLAPGRFDRLFLPGAGGEAQRRFELFLGQSIFTPEDDQNNPPKPHDRPFAGWLYLGIGFYQETNRNTLDQVQLLVGVIGPAALGREVQNIVHTQHQAAWAYQLKNEPGFVLSYERRWRVDLISGGIEVDAIPQAGVSLGNIFTYAHVGGALRIGQNMKADYGPLRVRPALSGGGWFDPARLQAPFGWYFYVGTQVRGVARDIFLDGNTFQSGPSVKKIPVVVDLSVGGSAYWLHYSKIDWVMTWRTKEFVDQIRNHVFSGLNYSVPLP